MALPRPLPRLLCSERGPHAHRADACREDGPRGALELTEDPRPPLRSHVLRLQPPVTPRASPAADHSQAPNSGESSSSTLRLRPRRKLRPRGRKRTAGNSHAISGTRASPHRAELPTPTHKPQAGSRFPPAPSYLPAWAGEPRAGGARPGESCRELCLGKVGGTRGGGPGGRLGISRGHSE